MRNVRRLRAVALALPLLLASGCLSLREEVNDSLLCVRNHADAWHAWRYYRHGCPDESWYPHHYGKGFRQGYRDVAAGGNGCPPTLPPSCYWSVCYQNPAGQAKVQEWFRGYVFGANAAQIDGVAEYNQIMTSERLFGRCGPQAAPGDVHYTDHGTGWSSDGSYAAPLMTPTPAPASGQNPPPAPGVEAPYEPYFPETIPEPSEPRAQVPQRELLQLLQSPSGPSWQ